MLVEPDFGKERCKIVRNFFEFFFGIKPIGETWKLGNGGVSNGPATRPRETSCSKLEVTIPGWLRAVGKFFENLGVPCPSKPIRAPTLKFVHSCETSVGSVWSAKNSSNLDTKNGVSGFKILVFCLLGLAMASGLVKLFFSSGPFIAWTGISRMLPVTAVTNVAVFTLASATCTGPIEVPEDAPFGPRGGIILGSFVKKRVLLFECSLVYRKYHVYVCVKLYLTTLASVNCIAGFHEGRHTNTKCYIK